MVFCCFYSHLLTSGGTCFPSNCHNCLFGRQLQSDRPHPLPPLLIFCFDFLYIYRYFFIIIINVLFFFASLSFLWYTFCGCLFATILHKPATRSIPNAPIHVCVCVLHMCGIFFSAFLCSFFRVILLRLCSLRSSNNKLVLESWSHI